MSSSTPFFAYRAWSISARKFNFELLENTVRRAVAEAPRHNINCIEIKDYCGYWVDLAAQYRNYPRLLELPQWSQTDATMNVSRRREAARRLKDMAQIIRGAGLELQVWYHCFRDWPKEVFELYPELRDADGEPLYAFLRDTLRDAFEFFPEITGLTVTSLRETPSILRFGGESTQESTQVDRLYRLYKTLHEECSAAGRRLILRDFIERKSEFADFEAVLDRLPDDIIIETKDVLVDWAPHERPLNPFIHRYAQNRKRWIVEFELSNNYTGELEFPWCDPEQIWRHIRLMAELGAYGAVGRLVNSDQVQAGTIFDTPSEINVWAFSRALVDPGRLLQRPDDVWWHDYDVFDYSLWTDWAKLRFGEMAASEVVNILRQSPQLTAMALNFCGAHYWYRLMTPTNCPLDRSVREVIKAFQRCGAGYARAEKAEAARIIEQSLVRIDALKDVLPPAGYANLRGAFERGGHILAVYRASTEAILAAMDVAAGRAAPALLKDATEQLRNAARECQHLYGPQFHEGMPVGALAGADYLDCLPQRLPALLAAAAP